MDTGEIIEKIEHRIRTHRAALAIDEKLGHPLSLDDAVQDTRARLEEAEAILGILRDSRDGP